MILIFKTTLARPTISTSRLIYIILLVSFSCDTFNSIAQTNPESSSKKIIKHQIEFRHDNDFLLLTDRYYSSGLFLSYRKRLENGFFNSGDEQLSFTIGQEVITPSDVKTEIISELDRPYVGFLGLSGEWSYFKNDGGVEARFLIGVAGRASGAGGVQRWYHNAVVVADPPAWVGEMENSIHFNMYVSYLYEWHLTPNPFSVYIAARPEVSYGTRDIYFYPELVAYFGRRNPTASSMAHNRIGSTDREIFFAIRGGYRFVGYNGLLEGNALGDNSILLVTPNKSVIYAGFDFQHRYGQNEYWFGFRLNSAESERTKPHKYLILSYKRNF